MDYTYYPNQAQPSFPFNPFPPTPANSFEPDSQSGNGQDVYEPASGLQDFGQNYQFSEAGFLPQQPQPQQQTPPVSAHRPPLNSLPPNEQQPQSATTTTTTGNTTATTGFEGGEYEPTEHNPQSVRSSSEEKERKEELSPAQARRQAQNRAAQRAFRERKERHVKDLEKKLESLSEHSTNLLSDNERLKRELQRLATQNEILRAQAAQPPPPPPRTPSPISGPQTYSPTDFVSAVGVDTHNKPLSYDSYDGEEGQRLLAAGATWDLIQSHELFRRGMVDVADVCRRLRGKAACDGRGPAFKESEVIRAIEESVYSGSDQLI